MVHINDQNHYSILYVINCIGMVDYIDINVQVLLFSLLPHSLPSVTKNVTNRRVNYFLFITSGTGEKRLHCQNVHISLQATSVIALSTHKYILARCLHFDLCY